MYSGASSASSTALWHSTALYSREDSSARAIRSSYLKFNRFLHRLSGDVVTPKNFRRRYAICDFLKSARRALLRALWR